MIVFLKERLMNIKRLLVAPLFALPALAQVGTPCSAPSTVHAITGNFSADLLGPVDTRPGTYGNADYVVWNQPFPNLPAGCRVQILHIDGDFIAYPMGAVPPGTSVIPTNERSGRLRQSETIQGVIAAFIKIPA